MVGPTKKPKQNSKGIAPEKVVATNTTKPATSSSKTLNFKRSAEFAREYKMYATAKGMTMAELLEVTFEYFKKHN